MLQRWRTFVDSDDCRDFLANAVTFGDDSSVGASEWSFACIVWRPAGQSAAAIIQDSDVEMLFDKPKLIPCLPGM